MRNFVLVVSLTSLLVTGCGGSTPPAKEAEPVTVGGACKYEEFAGTCAAEPATEGAKPTAVFTGEVRGEQVSLPGNPAMNDGPLPADGACKLAFITQGTCSPCVIQDGLACGDPAMDLMRKQASR